MYEEVLNKITVYHSSIKIELDKIIYFDPYGINKKTRDADIIFITHEHFDHYSPDDINKITNENTVIVCPKSMNELMSKTDYKYIKYVEPYEQYSLGDISFQPIPAYNISKQFHPKEKEWLGYIVEMGEIRFYVAGDTDLTKEAKNVKCDIAFLPCGGKYTMDYKEAARLAYLIKPKVAIPTHYGSIAGSKEDGKMFLENLNPIVEGVIKIKN